MATQLDIYHLRLINAARANPAGVAAALGIDLNEGLDPGTISADPKPPLAFNDILRTMAVAHSQDMIDNDFWSHTSPTTGTTGDRFLASDYDTIFYGENLSIIPSDIDIDDYEAADTMFAALFIDEGVSGRGHRKSILDGNWKEIGIGHLEGEYAGDNYTQMLTVCFGLEAPTKSYIVGCLYEDSNANADYDIGEGISSITVNAKIGATVHKSAVTDAYGYYAMEVDFGTYDVVAVITEHDSVRYGVEVKANNVLVDLLWDEDIDTIPEGNFITNVDLVQFNDMQGVYDALQPTNIKNETSEKYTLTWSMNSATKVYLDNVEVTSTGAVTLYATSGRTHTLRSVGPAGITEHTIGINVSVVAPFTLFGNKLSSGLDSLYGPSHEQKLRIS